MTNNIFYEIIDYIGGIIKGSVFENHVFAVGGACRDLIMGNHINDIDLVIELPNGGIDFANFLKESNYCEDIVVYPTYGTAMFRLSKFPSEKIECAMTRGEKYVDKDSRKPVCVFDTLEADAHRRDLTINAIYMNVSNRKFVDPTGGVKDIKEKNPLRTTNENPDTVMDEDPLRILRVIRFATRYRLPIERKTDDAMVKYVDRLEIISKERIRSEFNRILLCRNAVHGINSLIEIGAMKYIMPEIQDMVGLEQNSYHFGDVFRHTMALIDYYYNNFIYNSNETDLITLLSLLLHDVGKTKTQTIVDGKVHFYNHEIVGAKMVETILQRLRYDNSTIKEVVFLVKNHMRTKRFGDGLKHIKEKSFNKMAYECGCSERWIRLAKVIECDNMSHAKEHCIEHQFIRMAICLPNAEKMFNYKLPVDGNDVMTKLNIQPGIKVKNVLDKLLIMAFNRPSITKDECLKQMPFLYKQIKK